MFHNCVPLMTEIQKALVEGRRFFDGQGNALATEDEILDVLQKDKKVLACPTDEQNNDAYRSERFLAARDAQARAESNDISRWSFYDPTLVTEPLSDDIATADISSPRHESSDIQGEDHRVDFDRFYDQLEMVGPVEERSPVVPSRRRRRLTLIECCILLVIVGMVVSASVLFLGW